jgi:hypothetical protein
MFGPGKYLTGYLRAVCFNGQETILRGSKIPRCGTVEWWRGSGTGGKTQKGECLPAHVTCLVIIMRIPHN